MLQRATQLLAPLVVALAAMLYGCADDEITQAASGADEGAAMAAEVEDSSVPRSPEPTPAPTTIADEFERHRSAFIGASFRARYVEVGSDVKAELTAYRDGMEGLRIDMTAEQDGEDVEIVVVNHGQDSGFCLRNAGEFGELFGVEPDEGICFPQDPGESAPADLSVRFDLLRELNFEVVMSGGRKIAGIDAGCYVTRDDSGRVRTYCLSEDGILLAEYDEQGDGIEAVEASEDVEEDDFNMPYPVHALPTAGASQ